MAFSVSNWPTWLQIVSVPTIILPLATLAVMLPNEHRNQAAEARQLVSSALEQIQRNEIPAAGTLDGIWTTVSVRSEGKRNGDDVYVLDINTKAHAGCQSVLTDFTALSSKIDILGTVIPPQSLQPYRQGRMTVEPADRICDQAGDNADIKLERVVSAL